MNTGKIRFKDLEITYIQKPSLKHSYITVSLGEVTLKTPKVSNSYIFELLEKKEFWIKKQLSNLKKDIQKEPILSKEILFFGKLECIDAQEFEVLKNSLQRVKKPTRNNILKCYDRFYREKAKEYLTSRCRYFADIMEVRYKELKFKKMKRRWGSCNSSKIITLNINLLKLTKEQIDYVVVHELSHLIYMNHSREFHKHVSMYIENSESIKNSIKIHPY